MRCEERGCTGTVHARILTPEEVIVNCTKCTRSYNIPYAELKADIRPRKNSDAHLGYSDHE